MSVIKEYSYPSKSGTADIYAMSYAPDDGNIKAVFQISHGMAEHCGRYKEFAEYLVSRGFAVFINDHVGHGRSVKNDDDLGYFGEKNGWQAFVKDNRTLTEMARKEYPDLPVIFFGHSMGSFVAREYARRYGSDEAIKGFIFCGTSGKNPGAPAGIILANLVAKVKGSRCRSKLIDSIAFGTYNKRIDTPRTNFDWLTKDEAIVDTYIADKYSGFLFTAVGYRDMFTLLKTVSADDWYQGLNKDKPVYLTAGEMDPVGTYGAGVTQVYNDIKAAGVKDVSIRLYKDDRHEIHNELDRAQVYCDIADWAESKL